MKNEEIRKELDEARQAVGGMELTGHSNTLDAWLRAAKACVSVAEKDLAEEHVWEIPSLAKEFMQYAEPLEGYDHLLNELYCAVRRISDTVFEHPRIKLRLLEFRLLIVNRIECMTGYELSESEDLTEEIYGYSRKIALADKGELDNMETVTDGYGRDPIEWTQRWEEVVDEANKETFAALADTPRTPGFCVRFWQERAKILSTRFALTWRTPVEINPDKKFKYEKYPFIAC